MARLAGGMEPLTHSEIFIINGRWLDRVAGVIIVTFLLTRVLPGDTAAYFAGPAATPAAIAEIRARLGLDQPLLVQFLRYIGDLAHGHFGNSLTTGQPVLSDIVTRLPASAMTR